MLTGANSIPLPDPKNRKSVFSRLIFPSFTESGSLLRKGKEPIDQFIRNGPTFAPGRNLNFGSLASQHMSKPNLLQSQYPGFCSRCLSEGHHREMCRLNIKCFTCRREGHIALNCPNGSMLKSKEGRFTVHSKDSAGPERLKANANTRGSLIGPNEQQSPPVFASFTAWARSQPSSSQTAPPPAPAIVQWKDHLIPLTGGPNPGEVHSADTTLTLGRAENPRHAPSYSLDCTVPRNTNELGKTISKLSSGIPPPSSPLPPPLDQAHSESDEIAMAYQRADPNPFRPQGSHVEEVPNRPMMV